MKRTASWILGIVFIATMGAAQAAATDTADTADTATAKGAVSHHVQAATATRSAALVQAPAPEAVDAADAAVSPGGYALVLLGLGVLALMARRGAATPKFAAQ